MVHFRFCRIWWADTCESALKQVVIEIQIMEHPR